MIWQLPGLVEMLTPSPGAGMGGGQEAWVSAQSPEHLRELGQEVSSCQTS